MNYQETPRLSKQDVNTSILTLGTGWTGLQTAALLADLGYQVVLADEDGQVPGNRSSVHVFEGLAEDFDASLDKSIEFVRSHEKIEVLPETRLVALQGMPGRFSAVLRSGGTPLEREVGSVVLATDIAVKPLFAEYGLEPSEHVLSQSQLESKLKEAGRDTTAPHEATVAFLVGLAQEGNPVTMRRVMRSVEALEDRGCRVFVYVDNLKVAANGLERLYRSNRDKGAIYFKLRESPKISAEDLSITSYDPVLGKDVQLRPDTIVVEEALLANSNNTELADILRLDLGPWSFLQEDNVHRLPVQSNREGVFVAGEARDIPEMAEIWNDAANVALQVRELLGQGQILLPEYKGLIDKEKCCFCLTCYRCCPHGAISWDDKPFISPAACQACGICASECPQDAIQIVEYSDETVKSKIRTALKEAGAVKEPTIVAFCCENSAQEAWSMAQSFSRPLPPGLQTIKVPCAGKVDIDYIYTALTQGADGVAVLSCHSANCRSVRGNTFASWRVDLAQKMLQQAGLDQERLLFHTLASNMDHDLSATLLTLEKQLKALGPSPVKP